MTAVSSFLRQISRQRRQKALILGVLGACYARIAMNGPLPFSAESSRFHAALSARELAAREALRQQRLDAARRAIREIAPSCPGLVGLDGERMALVLRKALQLEKPGVEQLRAFVGFLRSLGTDPLGYRGKPTY